MICYKLDKSILTMEKLAEMTAALKGLGSVSEKARIKILLDKLSSEGRLGYFLAGAGAY